MPAMPDLFPHYPESFLDFIVVLKETLRYCSENVGEPIQLLDDAGRPVDLDQLVSLKWNGTTIDWLIGELKRVDVYDTFVSEWIAAVVSAPQDTRSLTYGRSS